MVIALLFIRLIVSVFFGCGLCDKKKTLNIIIRDMAKEEVAGGVKTNNYTMHRFLRDLGYEIRELRRAHMDMVDIVAERPWCNGSTLIMGDSYLVCILIEY